MKQVSKIALAFVAEPQSVLIPANATILDAGLEWGVPHLWCLIDPLAATLERFVTIVGDDKSTIPDGAVYIGTIAHQERFWHFFETAAP